MLPVDMAKQNAKERLPNKAKEKALLLRPKGKVSLNRMLIGDCRLRDELLNICFY